MGPPAHLRVLEACQHILQILVMLRVSAHERRRTRGPVPYVTAACQQNAQTRQAHAVV